MEDNKDKEAIKLLAIRNASGVESRIEAQQKLKDTAKKYILSQKNKNSSSGKTNQEKIEEYKDRYKYNVIDVIIPISALLKYYLNSKKENKLKILNNDIEKQVEEQINTTAKAFYGSDQNIDAVRRQEMTAKMKDKVNVLVNKIIEKNEANIDSNESMTLNQPQLEKLLLAQIQEVVNSDESLKGYFRFPGQTAQANVSSRPNPVLIATNQTQERQWKTINANNEVANYDKILGDIFKDKNIGDTVDISALKLTGLQNGDLVKLFPNSGCSKYVQITSQEHNQARLVSH